MTDAQLDALLAREGGFVDDPDDAGGATNMGITQATLSRWRGREVSEEEVQDLSRAEAKEIYRALYVAPMEALLGPSHPLLPQLVDIAVLHGPANARMLLMRAGASSRKLLKERCLFIARVVQGRPKNVKFLAGWIRRAFEVADGD